MATNRQATWQIENKESSRSTKRAVCNAGNHCGAVVQCEWLEVSVCARRLLASNMCAW